MVTGRRAFEGGNRPAKVVAAIMTTEPPANYLAVDLDAAFAGKSDQIKCLAKDPEESMAKRRGPVQRIAVDIGKRVANTGVAIPAHARSRRKLLTWVALALVAAAGVLALVSGCSAVRTAQPASKGRNQCSSRQQSPSE